MQRHNRKLTSACLAICGLSAAATAWAFTTENFFTNPWDGTASNGAHYGSGATGDYYAVADHDVSGSFGWTYTDWFGSTSQTITTWHCDKLADQSIQHDHRTIWGYDFYQLNSYWLNTTYLEGRDYIFVGSDNAYAIVY